MGQAHATLFGMIEGTILYYTDYFYFFKLQPTMMVIDDDRWAGTLIFFIIIYSNCLVLYIDYVSLWQSQQKLIGPTKSYFRLLGPNVISAWPMEPT